MNVDSCRGHAAARPETRGENEPFSVDSSQRGGPADYVIFEPVSKPRILELVELILKDRARLERLVRDPSLGAEFVPRLLAISMTSFVLFGLAATLVLHTAGVWPHLMNVGHWLNEPEGGLIGFEPYASPLGVLGLFLNGSALKLTSAYTLGLIAATGVCLPSLYFYGLLAGVRMSMLDVTVHALKAKATAAVALVGILPIYAAAAMGLVIFHAPAQFVQGALLAGLILPFVAGFWGTRSLYVGFSALADTMPESCRDRQCFLRRLVFAWSVVYTAVTPVMIFTLWEAMGT